MANTFFVVLPSNVSDYPDNKPNKYRVHLPKPIEFQGGNWVCGLYSIQYPQSWAATIGTDVKQWIQINYNQKKPHRIGIPKTTQLTPNGLSFFLKLVLSNKEKPRKRRDLSIDTLDDEIIIIGPEINLIEDPVKKRRKREADRDTVPLWIKEFFNTYPHNYWEAIRDYEQELEQHKVKIEEKTKQVLNQEDDIQKEVLQQELVHLHSLSEGKKKEIRLLTEEANKRDRLDGRLIANQFFEQHPADYHEQVIKMEINIIVRYIELEDKIKESREEGDKNVRSGEEIQRFINSIKRMRKNLEVLESAIIERDLKLTRDEFHQQNSNTHSEFVQKFFDDHPEDHWAALKKNLGDLQELHRQIREKRDLHSQEQDAEEKNKLNKEIDNLNKLASYRRNRFTAIHHAAYKKWKNFELPIPPTKNEIKEMQKIEEKVHPEYLEEALKVDDQGKPVPIPAPVITDEMLEVVKDRHGYEQDKARESEENEIKDKALKESKEKLKHARRIDKHGDPIPLDSQSSGEEEVAEEESFEKEEEGWDGINRKSPFLDLDSSEEIIPTEEIFDEKEYEQSTDALIKEKTVTMIEEKESYLKDLHSDIEFEYLDSIDRFRVIFNDPEIRNITISSQLCYVLGFPLGPLVNGQIGKYGIDLKGGFTSFAVYSKGLTGTVIMGNSVSSLLRIVAVENRSGGVVERVYDQPMFIPVLPREINEIEIELRWMNGSLVKFDHGTVIITLMFNRMIKF
uniref:Uncharacterized protein n=3 Tax=Meloidogyne enterolobii TaxID=390850 RepID=A0A6V7WVN5_MELEN|nr:unnamed protein product [Meloidogyne enterolobii]CAD2191002.1 unnamed protein product [Meloidogyne enterolobii]